MSDEHSPGSEPSVEKAQERGYLIEEMKLIRSQLNNQFREHERLMVFSASTFGVSYWSVIKFEIAASTAAVAVLLVPFLISVYGLFRYWALASFTELADEYLRERVEPAFVGEAGGYVTFYNRNRASSLTRPVRKFYWIFSISISVIGILAWVSAPELFLLPPVSKET